MTKEEAIKYLQQLYPNDGHCWLDEQRIEAVGMAVKALQEEPQVKKLAKLQHVNETCKENGNSLTHEPLSEELEEAAYKYACKCQPLRTDYGYTSHNPEVKEAVLYGAQWQKEKDAILPKVLNRENLDDFSYQTAYDLSNDWAKETPTWHDVEIACKLGANWQKEQIMANATSVTVHIDAGGYPYIPQMELYDYDKDVPLAKEGDKYKVILIKEE